MGFLLHDVGTDAQQVLRSLAKQCGSVFFEWAGEFAPKILPDATPAADFTVDEDDLIEPPQLEFAGSAEVVNHIFAYYRRDYRRGSGRGNGITGDVNPEASPSASSGTRISREA